MAAKSHLSAFLAELADDAGSMNAEAILNETRVMYKSRTLALILVKLDSQIFLRSHSQDES